MSTTKTPEQAPEGTVRTCPRCGLTKPLDEFEKDRQKQYGHGYRCRSCGAGRSRDYHARNFAERRAYAQRRGTPSRAVSGRKCKPFAGDPDKEKARRRLRSRVSRGTIKKPNYCEECRVICVPHGHHEDYSRPLDVIWLCPKCHMFRHRKPLLPPPPP